MITTVDYDEDKGTVCVKVCGRKPVQIVNAG